MFRSKSIGTSYEKISHDTHDTFRAVDPNSFFADPDPVDFVNADPDPEGKMNAKPCGSGSSLTNFVKNKLMKIFL